MKLMTVSEAKKYLQNETILKDSLMMDFEALNWAINKGWLIPIQFELDGETFFYTPEFSNDFGKYKIKLVYRVEEDVIKENLLIYPYRYKAELVEAFEGEAKENTIEFMSVIDSAITVYTDYSVLN